MVGDAQVAVALHLGPAPQLRRQELAVTVQGMGVQINHEKMLSVVSCQLPVKGKDKGI